MRNAKPGGQKPGGKKPEKAEEPLRASMFTLMNCQVGKGSGIHFKTKKPVIFPAVIVTAEVKDTVRNFVFTFSEAEKTAFNLINSLAELGSEWALYLAQCHNLRVQGSGGGEAE